MDFKDLLYRILEGKNNICLLCYQNTENMNETLQTTDEVTLNNQETIPLKDLLNHVLSHNVTEETFSSHVCKQCARSAIDSYLFKKKCQRNHEYLANAIENLTNTFLTEIKDENIEECESLYLIWNDKYLKYQQYFVYNSVSPDSGAVLKKKSFNVKRKRSKLRQNFDTSEVISITDMIYNKDDKKCLTCKECLNTFSSSNNLRKHYIRLHVPKKLKCTKCPRQYSSLWYLKQHLSESHNDCMCSQCGKTYKNFHSLKVHMLTHNVKIVCQVCGRKFIHEHFYNKHIELNICKQRTRKTPDQGNYTCDICKKKFCKKASLQIHIGFIHGNRKGHSCDTCKKKFSDMGKLRVHMATHTQEKNFTCEYCGVSFSKNESLVNHRRIHTGEKPFPCESCEGQFRSVYYLRAHMRQVHLEAKYECDICHKKFSVKGILQMHRIKHFDPKNRLYVPSLHKADD